MKIILFLLLSCPTLLFAQIKNAPQNFSTPDGKAIFVDFKFADYSIVYDPKTKTTSAKSKIVFETNQAGSPVFDLVETPTQIILNGEIVESKVINSPDKDTWFRLILKQIPAGEHFLEIESPIKQNVEYVSTGVSSAFWFTDLGDRSFLEAYLPSNFEYDQYKMVFNINFKNLENQKFYTNGDVEKVENHQFRITFPETYTSSSVYYHTAPNGRFAERNFTFRSLDGRDIPIVAYSSKDTDMDNLKKKILQSLESLEAKYGAFLHPKLTVFLYGFGGGMEYAGATATDIWALNHELTHSYFARGGLMPANGNAGWIDEAITTWSDQGSPIKADMNGLSSNMSGNSQYRRYTHMDAYSVGKTFMAHLNYKLQSRGGLTPFLNHFIQTSAFTPIKAEDFIKKISLFYSEDLSELFKKHTYTPRNIDNTEEAPPQHMKLTIEQMKQFL